MFLFMLSAGKLITLHERPQKLRFLAKFGKLNCFYLFITQDYSGKQFRVALEFQKDSFELCLTIQIDLDCKISTIQIYFKNYL